MYYSCFSNDSCHSQFEHQSIASRFRKCWAFPAIHTNKSVYPESHSYEEIEKSYREKHGTPPLAHLTDVADHIEHVAKVAGYDHVGIGGDFYGAKGDNLVTGLEDVSKYPELFAELIRRGWSDTNLAKLAQGNIMRVFKGVEETSVELRKTTLPSLKTLADLNT